MAAEVAFLFATLSEAAPFLQRTAAVAVGTAVYEIADRGVVILTGMGPQQATAATEFLLRQYSPRRVINAGVAGGLNQRLAMLALAVVEEVAAINEQGVPQFWWPTATHFAPLPWPRARLLTVEQPVCDPTRRQQLAAYGDLVDMEGAAIVQVCQRYGVPCLLLKAVSDQADAGASATLRHHLPPLAAALATALLEIWQSDEAPSPPFVMPDNPMVAAHALGAMAGQARRQRFGLRATYVHNLQINPTNLCQAMCRICGFAVQPGDQRAYARSEGEILAQVALVNPTEVHVVGGLSPAWSFARSLGLVEHLRRNHPALHIKAFTAVEIHWFAQQEGIAVTSVLAQLQQAGVNGLPGGGAEIFAPRMRQRFFPDKISGPQWLAIHRTAHRLGMTSNATLLFGLGESWQERLQHMQAVYDLQEETHGFQAFIPLPLQRQRRVISPLEILVVIALCRLVLTNIPHIKAYWPMMGAATASLALGWGADDLDGTIGQELVAHAGGATTPQGVTGGMLAQWIADAGFLAVERDGGFKPI